MLNITSLLRRRILTTAANRMMSTYLVGFSFRSPRLPWLVVEPSFCKPSSIKFWCCAEQKEYKFLNSPDAGAGARGNLVDLDMQLLGSSPGWLACQRPSGTTFLLDPVTFDGVHLPPWVHKSKKVETLVFSDSEGKAFVIFGSGRSLAFCSTPRPSDGWTLFGGALDEYESMVYSTAHRRLFCITSSLKLEAWDVGHDSPRLDWVAHFDSPDPTRSGSDVKYLACDEQSGKLFLVSKGEEAEEDLTVDFKVYRIDQRQRLDLMRDSLERLAFFVGNNNQAIAMRDGFGVEPDSVYFTYNSFVGNFDYRRRSVSRVPCPVAHNLYPVWFMAHPRHIIVG